MKCDDIQKAAKNRYFDKLQTLSYFWRMKSPNFQFKFLGLLCFAFFLNCTEPPPPTLNAKDRDLMDSLYRDSLNRIRPVLDSICEVTFDDRVQDAVDSIMAEREEEIRKQLERIRAIE